MGGPRIQEPNLPGIAKIAKLISSPIPQQELEEAKKEIWRTVGSPGTGFNINKFDPGGAKIGSLLLLSGEFEQKYSGRAGYNELQQNLAAAFLSQMSQPDMGLLGASYFQTFAGARAKPFKTMSNPKYLKDANLFIAQHINAGDLQFYLCDYEKDRDNRAVMKTTASCEDKLDYIMSLYASMRRDSKGDFVQNWYDDRQKVLVRAAVGQLKYMKDVEHKENTAGYMLYVSALAKKIGVSEDKMAEFVNSSTNNMLEWHLNQHGFPKT